ncbi:MAG TPA: DNA polymerase III subunit epsilon [Burkholderiales bacterium]|nr:DNA polymerase III subunit epsilon [Burkholderiales bacterium]
MRQIVLDTETTGLEPALGHRILEIAGVEIVNRRLTGRHFHCYLNPERDSDEGALQVHGLTTEFLSDKPKFREIVDELIEYIGGAELIIHNAPFDIAFLNREFELLDLKPVAEHCPSVIDTLRRAKDLHPGKRNNLDALCERYQVDNSARTLHGALLDAQLLAEVYLAMTRGQESLLMEIEETSVVVAGAGIVEARTVAADLPVITASAAEIEAHLAQLEEIDKASQGACVWKRLNAA